SQMICISAAVIPTARKHASTTVQNFACGPLPGAERWGKCFDTHGIRAHKLPVAAPMPPRPDHARWFVEEVQPHEPALRSFLRRRFPTIRDVDDLVQEAYARLMQARESGAILKPRAYLFAPARNAAIDLFRGRQTVSIEDL